MGGWGGGGGGGPGCENKMRGGWGCLSCENGGGEGGGSSCKNKMGGGGGGPGCENEMSGEIAAVRAGCHSRTSIDKTKTKKQKERKKEEAIVSCRSLTQSADL